MSIEIILAPSLGVSAEMLTDAWNADTEALEIGSAEMEAQTRSGLESTEITSMIIGAVIGGTIGIGFDALKHVIIKLLDDLMDKDKTTSVEVPANATINKIENPDGSIRVVITAPPTA
ncbi:MAG: hypothetical protein ACPG8W_08600 [Candidatus Promineifilaceae bacterium]